jgi:hypothetical protein
MEALDFRRAPIDRFGECRHWSRLEQEESVAEECPFNVLRSPEVLGCSPGQRRRRDGLAGGDRLRRGAAVAGDPIPNDPFVGDGLARNQTLAQTADGADDNLRAVSRDGVRREGHTSRVRWHHALNEHCDLVTGAGGARCAVAGHPRIPGRLSTTSDRLVQLLKPADVQDRVVLTGEGCLGQVFSECG